MQLADTDKDVLTHIAHDSVRYTIEHSEEMPIALSDFSDALNDEGATFVTLKYNNKVIGCMGSLSAHRPLVEDVVHNAFSASYHDSRFPDPKTIEPEKIQIYISLLSPAEEIKFNSEQALISAIRPGTDGLILSDKQQRGTFLPSVWESIPDPESFLKQLKRKAGLPTDYWSDTLKVHRYTTEYW